MKENIANYKVLRNSIVRKKQIGGHLINSYFQSRQAFPVEIWMKFCTRKRFSLKHCERNSVCIKPFLTQGSSVGRFGSHCNRAIAIENQHALREDTEAKRNACALDFGYPKENTNMPNGINDVASLLLTKCHTNHSSSPRLELFHLAHSRYFVKLEPTRGAHDPMDSRLLRSTSDMSELSQRQ